LSGSDQLIFLWGHASDRALLAVHQSLLKLNANVAFYNEVLRLAGEPPLDFDGTHDAL